MERLWDHRFRHQRQDSARRERFDRPSDRWRSASEHNIDSCRSIWRGLDSPRIVPLSEAKAAALQMRLDLHHGRLPDRRRREQACPGFEDMAAKYIAAHIVHLRDRKAVAASPEKIEAPVEDAPSNAPPPSRPNAAPHCAGDSRIEIELENGRRVRVGADVDTGALKRILNLLEKL